MRIFTPASSLTRLAPRAMILASLLLLFMAATKQPVAAAPDAPDATLRFSAPNSSGDVSAEGDDFFTNRLGDPVDFNNPADLDWASGWRSQGMSNGVWTGVSSAGDANFFLLFPGFDIAANGIDSRNGQVFPIDPNHYSHLVFKYTASANTNAIVYWMPAGDPYSHGFGNSTIYSMPAGSGIIDMDLAKAGNSGPAWTSSQWGGLRLSPGFGTAGVQVQLEWVRLVPASASPTITARWTCSGCSGNIDLYADTDNNGGNGGAVLLASGVSATAGSYNVPTAKLAGGNYYLFSKGGGAGTVYSPGFFTVRDAPILNITAPSTTSGEDYATSVLGKPWNMTTANALAGVANISNFSVGGGIAQGHPTNGDPAVYLLNANGPAIDTSRFKYLSFSTMLTQPGASPFQLARVLWYNTPTSANQTGDIITWYNYRQYFNLDLSRTKLASAPQGWSGTQAVLRIDPTEADGTYGVPATFQLGPVTLTGDPKVSRGQTTSIRWQVVRGSGTVALSYRPASGGNWTQFASGISSSAGGYSWNTANVTAGSYTIRAVVSDGANNSEWLSKVPLVVTGGGSGSNFADVSSTDYFYTPVQYLTAKNIISGYSDGTFRSFNETTRSQTAKILVLAKGYALLNSGSPRFRDVPRDNPFFQFVETAAAHGLISGYSDGNFRPYDDVTRAQLSKMIVVAQGWALVNPARATFNDVPAGSTFYTFIETAYHRGIISGYNDGSFHPGANAVRGQLSKIVYVALTSAAVENNAAEPGSQDEQATPGSSKPGPDNNQAAPSSK